MLISIFDCWSSSIKTHTRRTHRRNGVSSRSMRWMVLRARACLCIGGKCKVTAHVAAVVDVGSTR